MGDFAHYAEQGLSVGRTVPYEVTELRNTDGTHPLLHVEHYGTANATLLEESLAGASGSPDEPLRPSVADAIRGNQSKVANHCVRRLDRVFFGDGTQATDADVSSFIRAMPAQAFARLLRFVMDDANFYKAIATDPQALAEK